MPIWKPCIVWIAACALDALSYDTKPETGLQSAEYTKFRVRPRYRVHVRREIYRYVRTRSSLSLTTTQLTEAFAHVRVLIYENFGGYDVAEGQKGRDEVRVAELLRQMVDEKVATFGTLDLLVCAGELRLLRCRRRGGRGRRERGEPWNPNTLLVILALRVIYREDTIPGVYILPSDINLMLKTSPKATYYYQFHNRVYNNCTRIVPQTRSISLMNGSGCQYGSIGLARPSVQRHTKQLN